VSDALVGADRATELLALTGILDRHLHGPLGDPGELGGDRQGEAVATRVGIARHPLAGGFGDQAVGAGGVDRLEGLELDFGGRRDEGTVAVEGDDDVSGRQVAEEGAGAFGVAAERSGGLAAGELGEPLGALLVGAGR
jgi:hypothetical protein